VILAGAARCAADDERELRDTRDGNRDVTRRIATAEQGGCPHSLSVGENRKAHGATLAHLVVDADIGAEGAVSAVQLVGDRGIGVDTETLAEDASVDRERTAIPCSRGAHGSVDLDRAKTVALRNWLERGE
jgi:hypothetical protein